MNVNIQKKIISIRTVKINLLFLIRKIIKKRRDGGVFFKTEKMILDHACIN